MLRIQQGLVEGLVLGHHQVGAKTMAGRVAAILRYARVEVVVGQQHDAAFRHSFDVGERVQVAGATVLHDFGESADVRGDDRHFASHGLEGRETEAVLG